MRKRVLADALLILGTLLVAVLLVKACNTPKDTLHRVNPEADSVQRDK